jgi:hypothetical protein
MVSLGMGLSGRTGASASRMVLRHQPPINAPQPMSDQPMMRTTELGKKGRCAFLSSINPKSSGSR